MKDKISNNEKMYLVLELAELLYRTGEFTHSDANKFAIELVGVIEIRLSTPKPKGKRCQHPLNRSEVCEKCC